MVPVAKHVLMVFVTLLSAGGAFFLFHSLIRTKIEKRAVSAFCTFAFLAITLLFYLLLYLPGFLLVFPVIVIFFILGIIYLSLSRESEGVKKARSDQDGENDHFVF
jgi:fatty acid desaturase